MFNDFITLRGAGDAQFTGKTVTVSVKHFFMIAYLYMLIPIVVFCATWLRLYIAVVAIFTIGGGVILPIQRHQ